VGSAAVKRTGWPMREAKAVVTVPEFPNAGAGAYRVARRRQWVCVGALLFCLFGLSTSGYFLYLASAGNWRDYVSLLLAVMFFFYLAGTGLFAFGCIMYRRKRVALDAAGIVSNHEFRLDWNEISSVVVAGSSIILQSPRNKMPISISSSFEHFEELATRTAVQFDVGVEELDRAKAYFLSPEESEHRLERETAAIRNNPRRAVTMIIGWALLGGGLAAGVLWHLGGPELVARGALAGGGFLLIEWAFRRFRKPPIAPAEDFWVDDDTLYLHGKREVEEIPLSEITDIVLCSIEDRQIGLQVTHQPETQEETRRFRPRSDAEVLPVFYQLWRRCGFDGRGDGGM